MPCEDQPDITPIGCVGRRMGLDGEFVPRMERSEVCLEIRIVGRAGLDQASVERERSKSWHSQDLEENRCVRLARGPAESTPQKQASLGQGA